MRSELDEVAAFVREYMSTFDKPLPLHLLNKRFGVRLKKETGSSLKALLSLDERFTLILMENTSTAVAVLEA